MAGYVFKLLPGGGSMNKTEIAAQVAGKASLSKADAAAAVEAVFSAIGDALAKEETVTITGFGTFSTKSRPARKARNPRTGESVDVAASKAASFKVGKR